MIKITVDDQTKAAIEKIHWEWFKSRIYNTKSKFKHHKKQNGKEYFFIPRIDVIKWILGIKEESTLEKIINAKKDELVKFIKKFKRKIISEEPKRANFNSNKKFKKAYKKYRYVEILKTAFGYNDFLDSPDIEWYKDFCKKEQSEWNSKILCETIKVNVCPYCNREYVFTYTHCNKKKTLAEMDHFFPESKFPYLSCSLYNLIPSCHNCNSRKNAATKNIIYPYEEDFSSDFPFRVKFDKDSGESDNLIDIKNAHVFFGKNNCRGLRSTPEECRVCKLPKAKASISTFHLDKIYNEHKIELKDLFDRYRNYCQPKRKDILRLFHEDELKNGVGQLSDKQIEAVLSLYAKKMKKLFLGLPLGAEGKEYPLRKFKEDIIEQLDETVRNMRK